MSQFRISDSSRPRKSNLLLVSVLLLAAFWITTSDLQRDSLWADEAWTAWFVQPPYIRDTLERVRGDVHPPFYFLLLNVWGWAAGDSVLALRLPSALFGMIGLAATYAVGKKLFDQRTGMLALVILGTASFFVYYTREARMYMLLLALVALSMLLYLRWRERASWPRTILYGVSMALLMYTHYAGALVIATQVAHGIFLLDAKAIQLEGKASPLKGLGETVKGRRVVLSRWRFLYFIRFFTPYVLGFVLFIPWMPIFLTQMQANPNGPLAIPVPTNWGTVAALVLILTSGNWGLFVLPFVVSSAVARIRQYASAILLVVLWLVITPLVLLALNAWVKPVYQMRYAIAMLPAGALLPAYALRWAGLPKRAWQRLEGKRTRFIISLQSALGIILLAVIVYTQLTVYGQIWAAKPPWEAIIRQMVDTRQLLEPTITDMAPYSPAAYYDRDLHIRQGISLDLSWRLHSAEEARYLVNLFQNEPVVWVALPVNTAKTWHIVSELNKTRHVGYRSSLSNMIFYRFDAGDGGNLRFRFGDVLRYGGGAGADQQFAVQRGDDLCMDIQLEALRPLDGSYSAGLHLVDLTGTTNAAGRDGGLGTAEEDQIIDLAPCVTIPAETAPGHYHLELVVYNWSNLERLPVIEDGGGEGLLWQDVLVLAAVNVIEKQD